MAEATVSLGHFMAELPELERKARALQDFAGMPDIDSDYTELWRRVMGYAAWLAAGNAEHAAWLADTMDDMGPAFFDDVQAWERAESLGAIPYTPPAE